MKFKIPNDLFLFGEWYGIKWFHSCYFAGITKELNKNIGKGLSFLLSEQTPAVQRMYFSRSEWNKLGEFYLNKIVKNPQPLEKVLKNTDKASLALIDYSKELQKLKPASLSNKKIISILIKYHKLHHKIWELGMIPNVLELENSYLTDYLKKIISSKDLTNPEKDNSFQDLITPRRLSQAQKQELDILKLSQAKNPGNKIKIHHKKFKWLYFGWTGPDIDIKYFEDIQIRLYLEGKSLNEYNKQTAYYKNLVVKKKEWTKKFKLSKIEKRLFDLLEEILFIKAHRMDALFFSYSSIFPILKQITKQYFLTTEQLLNLYLTDIIDSLKNNKFDIKEINSITKHSIKIYNGKNVVLFSGSEAGKLIKSLEKKLPKIKNKKILTGQSAFPGIVTGIVKIINEAKENHKINKGEILVSTVTDPSLLPAMKKASAFITNSGGLTCHAAIVARELKIPCLVGTSIATKILKDGDKVEVNADEGIVKII